MSERDRLTFIAWHESVIAQYSAALQLELRQARVKWLSGVRVRHE